MQEQITMKKMFFFVLSTAALLLMATTQNAQAQSSETPKVEVGVHYTVLRTTGFGDLGFNSTDSGVGGRLTFNLTEGFGIEGELNTFPQDGRVNLANLSSINSHKTQALFGVKYGMRSEKFGIFGKLRPGFVRFSQGSPGALSIVPPSSETQFALDFGGVFEIYASRHVALRFDLGDTIIRYSNPAVFGNSFNSNNLQLSTGVAFRF
jgi:hypothetical protein